MKDNSNNPWAQIDDLLHLDGTPVGRRAVLLNYRKLVAAGGYRLSQEEVLTFIDIILSGHPELDGPHPNINPAEVSEVTIDHTGQYVRQVWATGTTDVPPTIIYEGIAAMRIRGAFSQVTRDNARSPRMWGDASRDPHCCYIPPGSDPNDKSQHCAQEGTIEIHGPGDSADYTHACGDHAGELHRPGDTAYNLKTGKIIKEPPPQ